MHTVFECLDIKGKEVIVADYTYPASAEAIILAGGIPVLADVDLESMNITADILEESYNEEMTVLRDKFLQGVPAEGEARDNAMKAFRIEVAKRSEQWRQLTFTEILESLKSNLN